MAQSAVPRRKCGKHDLTLPVLGLGAWSFGSGDYWGPQEQKDVSEVIEYGLSIGVDYIDTAEAYDSGKSEIAIGIALQGKKALIGSKVLPQNCTPEKMRKSLQNTLQRLQADHVFLYMVHWPIDTHKFPPGTPESDIPNVTSCFNTLKELQQEGKIKHIGVSNFGVRQLRDALATGVTISVNQLPYGLFLRSIEYELLPFCQAQGIGVIAYSPLLQGLLTGKYNSADDMPQYRTRTRHFNGNRKQSRHGGPGCEPELFKALNQIKQISENLKVSMAELALAWTLKTPGITCVIPGARNVGQLKANIKSTNLEISDEIYKKLQEISYPIKEHLGKYVDIYESIENQRISCL